MEHPATHKAQPSPSFNDRYWPQRWLILGVIALAVSGLFALLLALGRAPQFKELAIAQTLFNVGLVIHVDLSVLVWFLSMIGMGLSAYLARLRVIDFPYLQASAFWCMAAGTALMALSPLDGEWEAVKSNYIPVLHNAVFFMALGLMAASMVILSVAAVVAPLFHKGEMPEYSILWQVMGGVLCAALVMFLANAMLLNPDIPTLDRYEFVFWSGGHTLQFAYCLVAIIAWAALTEERSGRALLKPWAQHSIAIVVVLGVGMPVQAYLQYAVDDVAFQAAFTNAMIIWGGIPSMVAIVLIVAQACRAPRVLWQRHAASTALLMSILLFLFGGGLALLIDGQDTRIPAHYHGSIVGVTLGLMGYAYVLLPRFGWRDVSRLRMAIWQPVVLALGQALHIGGLAYAGGYGVLRKQAATGVAFAPDVKIALGVMGGGGLLAIIGGLMFVWVIWRATRP
jgi:cytochrome c oxidase subunit 1